MRIDWQIDSAGRHNAYVGPYRCASVSEQAFGKKGTHWIVEVFLPGMRMPPNMNHFINHTDAQRMTEAAIKKWFDNAS